MVILVNGSLCLICTPYVSTIRMHNCSLAIPLQGTDNQKEYCFKVCKKYTTKIEENLYISSQLDKKKSQDFDTFALGCSAVLVSS
jgi:hypothetical protein